MVSCTEDPGNFSRNDCLGGAQGVAGMHVGVVDSA